MIASFQRSAEFNRAKLDFICLIVSPLLPFFFFFQALAFLPSTCARTACQTAGRKTGAGWRRGAAHSGAKEKQLREMKAEEELKVIECWRILLVAEALFTAIYFFDSLPLGCGP